VRYAVKRIDEIPGVPDADPGDPDWKPLRHYFGFDSFGANVFIQPERSAMAVDAGTSVLVIAATSGKPYEVSAWDAKWTTGLEQA
jgi:hypothetical protein